MKYRDYDVVIIGGGASGMMAAIAAKTKRPQKRILLLERNGILGRKLLATGNGRCNFTNRRASWQDYDKDGFTQPVMQHLPPDRIIDLLGSLGVYHREEEEGRVYPYSGQGASVTEALERRLRQLNVILQAESEVAEVTAAEKGFLLRLGDQSKIRCSGLIIATGGKAGGQYGCQGDGYDFAQALGHDIVKVRPALTAVNCVGWNKQRKGVRCRGQVSLWRKTAEDEAPLLVAKDRGEIQFTDTGLSGICVFNLSRAIVYTGNMKDGRREEYALQVDFLPERSEEEIEALLLQRRSDLQDQPAEALLSSIVHQRLIPELLGLPADGAQRVSQVSDGQLRAAARRLKGWRFMVEGTRGFKDAQVTAGGVRRDQVNPQTMESLLRPGLYFCGEVLDVDGKCGGYNLQWAFASGYTAGQNAVG